MGEAPDSNIRSAETKDASRLAEILIFTKRCAYRQIFQNDQVSFHEMQVLDLALLFRDDERQRKNLYVYDDGIVKGLIKWEVEKWEDGEPCVQVNELYVDWFFQGQGIGDVLIKDCIDKAIKANIRNVYLWVLEKNITARAFYEKRGFTFDGTRRLETGTPEYLLKYVLPIG